MNDLAPLEHIKNRIFLLRGYKVMLSSDLAELYEVEVRILIQAVKRNSDRFPKDFMFQLSWEEASSLANPRSQFVILESGKNIKHLPYAFTEQGVAMLSTVLRSKRAVQVNIEIMRAFVYLRELLSSNKELTARLDALEKKHDSQFKLVFDAIRQLMTPPTKDKIDIGFKS
jgi:hypothetical protein